MPSSPTLPQAPAAAHAAPLPPQHVIGAAVLHVLRQAWIPATAVCTRASQRLGRGPYGLSARLVEAMLADLVDAGLVVSEPIATDPTVDRYRVAS